MSSQPKAGDRLDVGPPPGGRLPNLRLPDQTGRLLEFDEVRSGRPSVIVVYRSAVW